MSTVQTDYHPVTKVLLAYPERFYTGYDKLVPFYDELISLMPDDIFIWAITNNNQSSHKIEKQFSQKNIQALCLKEWDEIWLRDCIGIIKGEKIIKPEYSPKYCNQDYSRYYRRINADSRTIIKECLAKEIVDIPLKFECGNFVANDKYVFLTDKVVLDNKELSEEHIKQIINVTTGLTPIFVKQNKCDMIGHTDGYLNFFNDNQVLLAEYPSFPFLKEDINFLKQLEEKLTSVGVDVLKFYDRPVSEPAVSCYCSGTKHSSCFDSARGNYINYLQINNTIILPEYKLPTKRETNFYNKVNQHTLEKLGFEVKRINCDLLSRHGGSLHCISFAA